MPDDNGEPDWIPLIAAAAASRLVERRVQRHDGGLGTASKPQKFICDNEDLYLVKFTQNQHGDGRAIFTEQVVGRVGVLIGAPVAHVALVEVPAPIIAELLNTPDLDLGCV